MFNGHRTLAFAQAATAYASNVPIAMDVVVMGAGAPAVASESAKDIVAFPVLSDARIPAEVVEQAHVLEPSSLVRLAIIGDVAAETDFTHMVPLIREIVRIYRERGARVESPVLFIDYESVADSDLVGRWAFGSSEGFELAGIARLAAVHTSTVDEGPVPESLSAVEDLLGGGVAYECDNAGKCIGVKITTRDDYPKSLWPTSHAKQEKLLREICHINTVTRLAIPYSQCESLDLPVPLCRRLLTLDLRGSTVGRAEWLSKCIVLGRINLTACELTRVPLGMFACSRLRRVFLCKNRLHEINGPWGGLKNLEVLSLYRNNIEIIPDEIGQLVRMRRFNCGANPVRSLPMTMMGMRELENLQLDRTHVACVPEVCRSLPMLKRVSLRAVTGTSNGIMVSDSECREKLYQVDIGMCRAVLFNLEPT